MIKALAWVSIGGCLIAQAAFAQVAVDPLERFNRQMFAFNRMAVTQVINPTVEVVGPRLPQPVVTGLGNAYSNLTEIEFVLNNLLDGAPADAARSAGRFAVNSTVGVLGLFDVASEIGVKRRELGFVGSLCNTGIPPGPYVVLPLVGPANLYSTMTLATAIAVEVYALSFISTTLAAADFFIIDLGGSAAALRNINDLPDGADPYLTQRTEHMASVEQGCGAPLPPAKAAPPARRPAPSFAVKAEPSLKFRRAETFARSFEAESIRAVY
jgi:phospholipid-binding lipoprotein MlaA